MNTHVEHGGMINTSSQVPSIRALQIIAGAMAAGMIAFLAVAFVMKGQMPEATQDSANVLLLVLGVMGLVGLAGYAGFRSVMAGRLKKQLAETSDDAKRKELCQAVFGTSTIIRSAVCEGWGLFSIVFFMLTGNMMGFFGALLAIVLLLAGMPTEYRYEDFETQLNREYPCTHSQPPEGL